MRASDIPSVQVFRRTIGCFATGVAVITTSYEGEPFGMTVNSLTSVSLEPMVVLVCVVKGSSTAAAICRRGRFAINLLRAGQEHVSRRFVAKEGDRFNQGHQLCEEWNIPLVEDRLAHLICEVHLVQDVGDHEVLYGRVLACESNDGQPLLYWRGGYSNLTQIDA